MVLEFDPAKDAANLAKHGISLARAAEVDLQVYVEHAVRGEPRIRGYGVMDGKLYCLVFTYRGVNVRAISPAPGEARRSRRFEGGLRR